MIASVGDFDYSHLAGLRGVTVILRDITFYQCEGCWPPAQFVEIRCMGPLTRELEAAGALHVKQLWCSFRDNEWAIAFKPAEGPAVSKRRGRRPR
jgi:hypothetical protein